MGEFYFYVSNKPRIIYLSSSNEQHAFRLIFYYDNNLFCFKLTKSSIICLGCILIFLINYLKLCASKAGAEETFS